MKPEYIDIIKGQWLRQALKLNKNQEYKEIPTNAILNKTKPGLGATYMELHAKRHSIIIEPNVPVILGKTEKKKDKWLAVYEHCTPAKIKKYLNNSKIEYKKLISTPEGYRKIREVASEFSNLYSDFFLLFDECEKITQDHDYRPDISVPMNDLFDKFENKAFVSATPLIPSDPRFDQQNFRILKINPLWDYKEDINLIATNDYERALRSYLSDNISSNCICIFINSTNSINEIINSFPLTIGENYKVFCSDKSVRKLKDKKFDKAFDKLNLPLSKYNFFTSRFFSALDIKLTSKIKPDILILTNNISFTRIDPYTEAIQIYGRFRNGFNSLTHIATYDKNINILSDDEIDKMIETKRKHYELIKETEKDMLYDFTNARINTTRKTLDDMPYSFFLDENKNFNYFAKDHVYDDARVERYYISPDAIKQAYEKTEHFKVNYSELITDEPLNFFRIRNKNTKQERKEIVNLLDSIEDEYSKGNISDILKEEIIASQRYQDSFIVDFYYAPPIGKVTLGKAMIEKLEYNNIKMRKLYGKYEKEKYRLRKSVADDVFDNFKSREGKPIPKEIIKLELEEIYEDCGVTSTVTLDTIKDYYDKPKTSGKNQTYTLINRKKF